ncbi:MAG: flagellar transcriptional regulator FlhD [Casimicrobiaceae bacterium]
MKTAQMLDDIREANLTYLILAQRLIREDRIEAMFRLGISEEVADILAQLATAQIVKIAASNMLMCRFRFDDQVVWNLLLGTGTERGVSRIHAAILMAQPLAEVA